MQNSLLDALKRRLGVQSDAQLARLLGLTRTPLNHVRHGRSRLGLATRLRILDLLAYQGRTDWISRLQVEALIAALQEAGGEDSLPPTPPQRQKRTPGPEGRLLDLVQASGRFATDADLADFLGIARESVVNARAGRTTLGPRPRLRILNHIEPFDLADLERHLESDEALLDVLAGYIPDSQKIAIS